MSARCQKCGYTLEHRDCYPCQRDEAEAKLRRAIASLRRLADAGFSAACRNEAQGAIDDILGQVAPPTPDLHPGELEPMPQPRGRMADGRVETVETDRVSILENALLNLRGEVERNRLRAIWQIVGVRGDVRSRLDPEFVTKVTEPHEHHLHRQPCCIPECGGKWGINCPHCHRLDHRCGSEFGP